MKEIKDNAEEFMDSGNDNLKKERWNAASSDFFKAITNMADLLIYKKFQNLPDNHNERFNTLKKYFPDIYLNIKDLFLVYRKSYNLRLKKEDALKLKQYAEKLRKTI